MTHLRMKKDSIQVGIGEEETIMPTEEAIAIVTIEEVIGKIVTEIHTGEVMGVKDKDLIIVETLTEGATVITEVAEEGTTRGASILRRLLSEKSNRIQMQCCRRS